MNEYTRREEVRWTFISSLCLVLFIGPAVVLLVNAKGKTVPDPSARLAAKAAQDHVLQMHGCTGAAEHLATEIDVYKAAAKAAHLEPEEAQAAEPPPEKTKKKKPRRILGVKVPQQKEKPPDASLAWPAAQPSYKLAKALAACEVPVTASAGAKADAAPGWAAIQKVAAIEPPDEGDTKAMVDDARTLLKQLGDAPIDKVIGEAREAEAKARQDADATQKRADTATIVEPIPEGFVPRRVALGVGIGICVVALIISYLSVRVASMRRLG
ncbi:MAG TPA: hypothetical protein VHB21_06915, partial [Minicystis sp.]|nr:hypothetical protein [Minicystis sp.]